MKKEKGKKERKKARQTEGRKETKDASKLKSKQVTEHRLRKEGLNAEHI